MLEFSYRPRALVLTTALSLLLAACTEAPSDELETADYGYEEAETETDAQAGSEMPETANEPELLGQLAVQSGTSDYDLKVTGCTLTSMPSPGIAIAWFRLDAESAADDGLYVLEFQMQETPTVSGVALLSFENSSANLLYAGASGQALPGPYQLSLNGADFDVRSGNNGALEPVGSGFADPVWVDTAATFSVAALQETSNSAEPFAKAELTVSLASRCQLSWRLAS